MAKSKADEWLKEDKLTLLTGWARQGLTNEQIANNMGINASTLYDYINKFDKISNALKKGKEVVDFEVENALLKKALGYNVPVRKAFKIKEVLYEQGKRIKETEKIEYADEEVHIPADTTAQIFWLKNRMTRQWRDKIEVEANKEQLEKVEELLSKIKEEANDND